jgi:cytochrome c oxidase cbb3-type subunit 1
MGIGSFIHCSGKGNNAARPLLSTNGIRAAVIYDDLQGRIDPDQTDFRPCCLPLQEYPEIRMQALSNTYNDKVVRQFAYATVLWGIVGMLDGVLISAQLYWPSLNFDTPWLSYGRLRPLHTNAMVFAFGGSVLFSTSLYVVQRTCHVRLISDKLASFVFWGWQAIIVAAAITLPMGLTQGKEYAELEWPIDIAIAVVWIAYGVLFFGTIAKRKVKHIYVANWFYGAYIIAR